MGKLRKTALCLLVFGAIAGTMAAVSTKEVNKTVELNLNGRISLETYKGSVNVTTWDSRRVEINARVEPDGNCSDDEERVRDTEVQIDSSAGSLRIKSDYGKAQHFGFSNLFRWNCGSLPFVNYSLRIPRTAQLKIKDYKSEIRVDGLRSGLQINSYKGNMRVAGLDGSLDLETYKGEARVEFSNLAQNSRMDTYKGKIDVFIPSNNRFNLDADLGRHGNLNSDFTWNANVQGVGGRRKGYHGAVNGGGPLLYLKTYKGEFRLKQR
jgi:DUF4097 and DUF4098 domain-containing protein YvlB